MGLTVEDLRPKSFQIEVEGVKLNCKPLKLSHALIISKLGNVFQNPNDVSKEQINQAETDLTEVINELIPELKDIPLSMNLALEVITQMMESIQPSDNKELQDKGVKIDADPKA